MALRIGLGQSEGRANEDGFSFNEGDYTVTRRHASGQYAESGHLGDGASSSGDKF